MRDKLVVRKDLHVHFIFLTEDHIADVMTTGLPLINLFCPPS